LAFGLGRRSTRRYKRIFLRRFLTDCRVRQRRARLDRALACRLRLLHGRAKEHQGRETENRSNKSTSHSISLYTRVCAREHAPSRRGRTENIALLMRRVYADVAVDISIVLVFGCAASS